MVSRRVFVKNSAFALVSLGFAPSFDADRYAGTVGARQTAHRDLPARAVGPERRCPIRRQRNYRARPAIAIARQSPATPPL